MNKKYQICIDIINILLRFITAFSIMGLIFYAITRDPENIRKALYLLPASAVSYLIGRKAKRLWEFIVMHILMISAYAFIADDILSYAIFGMYLMILAVMAFARRINKNPGLKSTPVGFIAAVAVTYLYCLYMKLTDMAWLFLGIAMIFMLLYLLNLYLINFINYFQKYKDMNHIPIRQITKSNHILFFAYGIVCFAVMLLFTLLPAKDMLSFLGRLIVMGLRAFFSLFHSHKNSTVKNVPDQDASQQMQLPEASDAKPSPFFEMLSKILIYAVIIAIIGAVIVGIIYGLYSLYKKFYAVKTNDLKDKMEFISPFEKKKLNSKGHKSVRKILRSIFAKTNNEKIRKHYYNAIVSNARNDQLRDGMTPAQLTRYAFVKENGLLKTDTETDTGKEKDLTTLYEKARYSREECSKNDVLKVKELLK